MPGICIFFPGDAYWGDGVRQTFKIILQCHAKGVCWKKNISLVWQDGYFQHECSLSSLGHAMYLIPLAGSMPM